VRQADKSSTLAVCFDVAERPDRGRAGICSKDRVRIRVTVDQAGKILRVNLSAVIIRRVPIERFDRLRMPRQAIIEEFAVRACGDARQKGGDRVLDVADDTQLYGMAAAEVSGIDVDLNDVSVLGVELPPGKIAAQEEQRVAVHQGMVAGGNAKDTSHADVGRIVVLEEVLRA
jgi:hypothetical protein